MMPTYEFDLDGPLFKEQRRLLCRIAESIRRREQYRFTDRDGELLEGLTEMTDAIADQAHDRHGIDCLLNNEDGDRCRLFNARSKSDQRDRLRTHPEKKAVSKNVCH
jgi:hypothetical protein